MFLFNLLLLLHSLIMINSKKVIAVRCFCRPECENPHSSRILGLWTGSSFTDDSCSIACNGILLIEDKVLSCDPDKAKLENNYQLIRSLWSNCFLGWISNWLTIKTCNLEKSCSFQLSVIFNLFLSIYTKGRTMTSSFRQRIVTGVVLVSHNWLLGRQRAG